MIFGMEQRRLQRLLTASLLVSTIVVTARLYGAGEASVEELKSRVANTGPADRPPLCLQISELQLGAASKAFDSGNIEHAKAALTDVIAFSELAGHSAIQSHKHQKKAEIAIRKMTRKLTDLKHKVSHEDQQQVQTAIDQLQRIRDDLLASMFPKVGQK